VSAGRCAGPAPEDVGAALPAVTVAAASARRRLVRVALRARRGFTSGPFRGEVRSDVDVTLRRTADRGSVVEGSDPPASVPTRRVRRVELRATFVVRPAGGTLVTTSTGGPAPACRLLDACGLTGRHELALLSGPPGAPTSFSLFAEGDARAVRGRTVAAALRALAAGRLDGSSGGGASSLHATTRSEAGRPGGPTCRDARTVAAPMLVAQVEGEDLRLAMGGERTDEVGDVMRTRCPGPTRTDVADVLPLATGTVPLAALSAATVDARLAPGAPAPEGGPFALERSGALALTLHRRSARVRTVVREVPVP
jgi:hypothetical protein